MSFSPRLICLSSLFLLGAAYPSSTLESGGKTWTYYSVVPPGLEKPPLVLLFHGLGSSGDQTFIQKQELMTFGEDGSLIYGGSKTSVGGNMSDYSEQAGGEIPNVVWHTKENCIYLTAKDKSGKQETAKLGKYYIEDGKMLITSDDGTKLVLLKQ